MVLLLNYYEMKYCIAFLSSESNRCMLFFISNYSEVQGWRSEVLMNEGNTVISLQLFLRLDHYLLKGCDNIL